MSEEKICRVCFEAGGHLIKPCKCSGYSKYIHRECLDNWRNSHIGNSYYECEVCKYRYRISKIWWSKLLESNVVIILITIVLISSSISISGYMSSSLYNRVYYWFMHEKYHSPHRLSILFHGLFYNSLPGFYLMLQNIRNIELSIPRINMESNPWWYYRQPIINNYYSENKKSNEKTEEKSEEKVNEKTDKSNKKKTPIAEKPNHANIYWIVLIMGVLLTKYYSYKFINNLAKNICVKAQEIIEDID